MRKSEELRKKAEQEDNDLKALGIYTKVIREERSERFEKYLPQLQEKYDVREDIADKFTIETEKFGTVDFFPKANKILIRKRNKWIKPGLRWIRKNLL